MDRTTPPAADHSTIQIGAVHPPPEPHRPGTFLPLAPDLLTWLYRVAMAVSLLCALAILALGAWLAGSGLISVRGVDLNVVFTIQKVLLGSAVYTDPAAPPFEIAQYGPLFYLLVAAVARLAGTPPTDAEAITLLARSVSVVATMAIFAVAYRFARDHVGADRPIALLACAFGLVATSPWYFMARPDGLMALALLGTLYCVLRGESSGASGTGWLVAAGVLALAALLAKQNGVSAVVVATGYLALRREWRGLATVLATLGVVAAAAWAAGAGLIGEFARANMIDGLDNGISLRNAWLKPYSGLFGGHAGSLALLLFALLAWRRSRMPKARLLLIVSLGWLFVFSSVTALKVGSAENYYNEFLVVAALAVATWVVESRRARLPAAAPLAAITALYLLVALPFWMAQQWIDYGWDRRGAPRLADFQPAVRYLRVAIEPDAATLVLGPRGFANALPTRSIVPQPELLRLGHSRATVDLSLYRAYVESGRIGYVVHGRGRPLTRFLGVDFRHFVPLADVGGYSISVHPALHPVGTAEE